MKKLIIILLLLPVLASAQPFKFSEFNLKNNFPGTWKLAGYIDTLPMLMTPQGLVPTRINKQYDGGILLNRANHTGTQPASSISDFNAAANTALAPALAGKQTSGDYASNSSLNAGLAGKQNTLIAGTNITISNNTISANGGNGSFNPNDPQTQQAIAQISRDSAQNNLFPTSGKTFEVVDGKLFLRGERFTPTVQAGSNINSNASASLDPGSTDRAGVVQLIVSITISPSDNTQLVLVSFGGTVYANPPSVTPAIGQTAPGIKVVSVTTTGFTLASTGSFTLPPGTYRFPYHTEPL